MKLPSGITFRLVLLILVPSTALALAFCAFYIFTRLGQLERQFTDEGNAYALQLARATETAIANQNPALVAAALRANLESPDVLRTAVLGLDGAVSSEQRRPTYEQTAKEHVRRFVAPVRDSGKVGGGITVQPNVIARVEVALDSAGVTAEKSSVWWRAILSALAALTTLAGLAVWQARRFARPLADVSEAVRRLTSGDLRARAQPQGPNEVRVLGHGVNNLARAIAESQRTLSDKVENATSALKAQRDEASAASQAKSRFLAAASHDLRQPMHALGLFCTALSRKVQEPEQRQLIGNIQLSLQAMEGLFESLLDLSRLDAGRVQANMQVLSLTDVLQWVGNEFTEAARDKGLRLRVRTSDEWCYADPTLLRRILLNLTSNAIRYTKEGGVLVGVRRRGELVRIEVWDTGRGIDSANQAAIFEEFVQLDNPVNEKTKGLGLGLAIAQKSAMLMGTRIQVKSKANQGSVFAIDLIGGQPNRRIPNVVRDDPDKTMVVALRVLVIEDDDAGRHAMSVLLEHWACDVRSVEGATGLDEALANGWTPELIISDFRLRGTETGPSVIEAVQTRKGGVALPVLIVSGELGLNETHGADWPLHWQYMKKPVSAQALRASMGAALQAHSAN
jgi:two-component system, sensor histidine kinase